MLMNYSRLSCVNFLLQDAALFEKVYPDPKSVQMDAATITQEIVIY